MVDLFDLAKRKPQVISGLYWRPPDVNGRVWQTQHPPFVPDGHTPSPSCRQWKLRRQEYVWWYREVKLPLFAARPFFRGAAVTHSTPRPLKCLQTYKWKLSFSNVHTWISFKNWLYIYSGQTLNRCAYV